MLKQQEERTKKLKKFKLQGPCAYIFTASNTGSWRIDRPVVDPNKCTICGTCSMYCPVDAITMDREKKEIAKINLEYCKGCGICANECPRKCIEMIEERSFRDD